MKAKEGIGTKAWQNEKHKTKEVKVIYSLRNLKIGAG